MTPTDFDRPPSNTSKEIAKQNILTKVTILELWLKDGIPWELDAQDRFICDEKGRRIHIAAPDSLRSFNAWRHELYSSEQRKRHEYLSHLSGNGTDTLNKYPDLKARVVKLIQSLNHILESEKLIAQSDQVEQLKLEIKKLRLFIQNQNTKIVQFQRENILLKRSVSTNERREKGNFEELRINYKKLEMQNSHLREEISLLTKQLNNVHSLRDVNREK